MPNTPLSGAEPVAFDLETTGIDVFTDRPVSYAFVGGAGELSWTETALVNPGRPIPAGASAVHGITDAMVHDAMDLSAALGHVTSQLDQLWDTGGVVVGMNVAYDLTIVDATARALGLRSPLERDDAPVVDVLVVDRHFDRYRKGKRRLNELCAVYGVTLEDAHQAEGDASATLGVYRAQLERYGELGAIDLADASRVMGEWYRDWLSNFSDYLVRQGRGAIEAGRYHWPVHRPDEG